MNWSRILRVNPYYLWATVMPVGAGLLSIASAWPLVILAPLFIIGGLGVFFSVVRDRHFQTMIWLGFLAAVSLTRAAALWNIDQHGVGSNFIATWTWLCLAWAFLIGAHRVSRYGP